MSLIEVLPSDRPPNRGVCRWHVDEKGSTTRLERPWGQMSERVLVIPSGLRSDCMLRLERAARLCKIGHRPNRPSRRGHRASQDGALSCRQGGFVRQDRRPYRTGQGTCRRYVRCTWSERHGRRYGGDVGVDSSVDDIEVNCRSLALGWTVGYISRQMDRCMAMDRCSDRPMDTQMDGRTEDT